jgi:hypothetical protein
MAQVVEDAHEEDEVELFAEVGDLPDGHAAELDVEAFDLGSEARDALRRFMACE